MEKNRQIKIMFIVALILSVTAMTLGFAAFSTTLNISSSASVTPDSSDFRLEFVGINGDNIVPVTNQTTVGSANGYINADGISISGMNAVMNKPGDSVVYNVLVKNTGKYDAYVLSFKGEKAGTNNSLFKCTPVDVNFSSELLEQACNSLTVNYGVYDVDTGESLLFENNKANGLKIPVGGSIRLSLSYRYLEDGVYADGAFNAEIGKLSMEFTSAYVANPISFTISGKTYYAEENMTWQDWVNNSTYNVDNYTISEDTVYIDTCTFVNDVTSSDVIQMDGVYSSGELNYCSWVDEW